MSDTDSHEMHDEARMNLPFYVTGADNQTAGRGGKMVNRGSSQAFHPSPELVPFKC